MFKFFPFIVIFSCILVAAYGQSSQKPRSLILIISSKNLPVYIEQEQIWRAYMNQFPDSFESYFICGNPEVNKPYQIQDQTIWVPLEESTILGVINKTLLALEALSSQLDSFDFVIRTNLSSFLVLPNLAEFLQTLPKKRCYSGDFENHDHITFAPGNNLILSSDLAKLLITKYKSKLYDNLVYYDDLLIGAAIKNENLLEKIHFIPAPREIIMSKNDWDEKKNHFPEKAFHFRFKYPSNERLTLEVQNMKELLQTFYNKSDE